MSSITMNGFDGFLEKLKKKRNEFSDVSTNDDKLDAVMNAGVDYMSGCLAECLWAYEGDYGNIRIDTEKDGATRKISLVGDKVLYIEFGYGLDSANNPHPMQGWNGAVPGAISDSETGKHRWQKPPWTWDRGVHWSYGMAPGRPVFDTAEYLKQNYMDIIRNGGASNDI